MRYWHREGTELVRVHRMALLDEAIAFACQAQRKGYCSGQVVQAVGANFEVSQYTSTEE